MIIAPATAADAAAIETLLDAGFGTERHGRTAYRLRDGATPRRDLSFVARAGDALIGSLQCWDIMLVAALGAQTSLLLLGPVAVAAGHRGRGVASALMTQALAAADSGGAAPLLLIGDAGFYGRFGFVAGAAAGWTLPGPVEPERLLLRGGAGLPKAARIIPNAAARRAA